MFGNVVENEVSTDITGDYQSSSLVSKQVNTQSKAAHSMKDTSSKYESGLVPRDRSEAHVAKIQ